MLPPALCCALACDRSVEPSEPLDGAIPPLTLSGMARFFSELPLTADQVREVGDAVASSMDHGYDEEYMMCDLFASPGAGVGSGQGETRARSYAYPLRDLIRDRLSERVRTRSGDPLFAEASVEAFVKSLTASGMQIYWPYSASWDGSSLPVITFDPESEARANVGYEMVPGPDGEVTVREVVVDEEMARSRPVWVLNANDDSGYLTLEQLRRQDPHWGQGGRVIIGQAPSTRSGDEFRSLILKDFKMKQHYDSWFRGASEFWVLTIKQLCAFYKYTA